MIDALVETEFLLDVFALLGSARDADCACALYFRDLPDHRSNSTRRRRDHHSLAGLWLPNFQQSRVAGHPRHAEHAERGRNWREFRIELAQPGTVRNRMRLPAGVAEYDVARLESVVVRGNDFIH